ncbi:MAG TPA: FAD-dependent oxidoreductase, partial [Rhodopila sp.]
MMTQDFDIAVIGAGMAGATAAAYLSADKHVALIEAEEVAGYHTTGRSAAIWILNYGPPDVRVLTRLSRSFYETPPAGFSDVSLIRRRAVLLLASEPQSPDLESALASGEGLRRLPVE